MTLDTFVHLAIFMAGSNALALAMQIVSSRRLRRRLVHVGYVESIHIYPIKSCSGVLVDKAICDESGIQAFNNVKDRHFVVVTDETSKEPGRVMSQRQYPEMALVQLRLLSKPRRQSSMQNNDNNTATDTVTLCFSAPGMPDLQIRLPLPHDSDNKIIEAKLLGQVIVGRHCGFDAARWWQNYLKRDDVILIHAEQPDHLRPLLNSKKSAHVESRLDENDKAAYVKWSPLHIVNAASLDELNSRIEASNSPPVDVYNFRPNLLIRTKEPFEEDNFDRIYIGPSSDFQIDDDYFVLSPSVVILRSLECSDRCALTIVDPRQGKRRTDGEPLKTLRSFRVRQSVSNSPLFGISVAIDRTGRLCKGDAVYATFLP